MVGVSVIFPVPPLPLEPVQLYVVPGTSEVGVMFRVVPEHTMCVPAGTELPVGCTSFLITTSSVLGAQVPLLIVQRNVALLPAAKPVTVVVAFVGSVMVMPAGPPTSLHRPVPTTALLPLSVNVLVLHWNMSAPAAATVGVW